jgi:histidinol-phosphate/aromatic aminotransferase/cobyric acid decarboxylase-like protein
VLPTSGGAEAFTLVARAIAGVEPGVVHPQFTEPEAALAAAGRPVRRILLDADAAFPLDPEVFAPGRPAGGCDLLVVGNPTNPTGVLHARSDLLALRRPGRVVVVDEAFMDAVPGESESLIGADLEGLVVLRSLTKTWGLAGLRAGYAVGDPQLIAALRAVQPPWSVSTPALAATVACVSDRGLAETEAAALEIARHRALLVDELSAAGLEPVPSAAPFVLVDTRALGPGSVRQALAAQGFAVRRGETFPGLGPTWIRLAVRDPQTSHRVAAALGRLGGRRVA